MLELFRRLNSDYYCSRLEWPKYHFCLVPEDSLVRRLHVLYLIVRNTTPNADELRHGVARLDHSYAWVGLSRPKSIARQWGPSLQCITSQYSLMRCKLIGYGSVSLVVEPASICSVSGTSRASLSRKTVYMLAKAVPIV